MFFNRCSRAATSFGFAACLATTGSAAAQPFSVTSTFDIGGGGCIGETRVYEDQVSAAELKSSAINPPPAAARAVWRRSDGRMIPRASYFLTTIGCGADRVAISIDGKAHVLAHILVGAVGHPVTYFADDESAPRVRIEGFETLYRVRSKETDCTQHFERVRVHVEYKGSTRELIGTSVNQCP